MCNNYSKAQKYFTHLLLHWQNRNTNKCTHIIIIQIFFPQHPFQILMCIHKQNFRFHKDKAKLSCFTGNNKNTPISSRDSVVALCFICV